MSWNAMKYRNEIIIFADITRSGIEGLKEIR
jgi:hypothetical protein